MENNYETLRMPELKALARDRRLRHYSRMSKAELVAFLSFVLELFFTVRTHVLHEVKLN